MHSWSGCPLSNTQRLHFRASASWLQLKRTSRLTVGLCNGQDLDAPASVILFWWFHFRATSPSEGSSLSSLTAENNHLVEEKTKITDQTWCSVWQTNDSCNKSI